MITVNLNHKKNNRTAKSDNPELLGKYLMYGITYEKEVELSRVKFKGAINFGNSLVTESDSCDLALAGKIIDGLNKTYAATATKNSKDVLRTQHYEISLNAQEHLNEAQWHDVVLQHLKTLGLESHLAFYAVHKDNDNEHCHLVVSTVNPDTLKIANLSFEHRKLMKLDNDLENKYGLVSDNHGLEDENKRGKSYNSARNIEALTGQESLYSYVKRFKKDLEQAQSWQEFHKILHEHNLSCEKSGRGIIFSTPDPEKKGERLYIKASAFNVKGEPRITLNELEKKFGEYEKISEETNKFQILEYFEAKPVNFLINDHSKAQGNDLLDAFDKYKEAKKSFIEQRALIDDQLKALKIIYEDKQKKLKRSYNSRLFTLKKKYVNAENLYISAAETEQQEFEKLYRQNEAKYEELKKKIKDKFTLDANPTSFLSYLKNNFSSSRINIEKRLLLLTRKHSLSQYAVNYGRIQRKAEIKVVDYSVGMYELAMMNVVKCTNKGQQSFVSKNRAYGDWIKDDGKNILINDNPNVASVKDFLVICEAQKKEKTPTEIYGLERFQRTAMEIGLKNDYFLKLDDFKLQKEYEERLDERREHTEERRELREFSDTRTEQRNRSYVRAGRTDAGVFKRLHRGNGRRRAIRRFLVDESGSSIGTGNSIRTAENIRSDRRGEERAYSDTRSINQESSKASAAETNRNNLSNPELSKELIRSERREDTRSFESSLRDMSELLVAGDKRAGSVLLPGDERNRLAVNSEREILQRVRWPLSDEGTKISSQDVSIAETNTKNIEDMLAAVQKITSDEQKNTLLSETAVSGFLEEHQQLAQFIEERNDKFSKGFDDVLPHYLFTDESGDFIYRGIRTFGEDNFVLLEQNDNVYVKPIENGYALNRLRQTKRGSKVTVTKNGKIINHNKARNTVNTKRSRG
ncbi:MAG: relaxase/mobilization nuclease domain-containing protein [Succinivibrio dextrinosolvens]|nr:relaxase/mobilization nuclease domain-containing protein [Succinivibrio dextrinosolvens]